MITRANDSGVDHFELGGRHVPHDAGASASLARGRAGHDHSAYDRRNHGATAIAAVARTCLSMASSATCGSSNSNAGLVLDPGPRIALRLPTGATSHDVTTSSSSMVIVVVLGTSVVSVPPSPVLAVQVTSQCVVAVTV